MPIEELSDLRRLSRDFKVRLGTRIVKGTRATAGRDEAREPGASYPKEQDYFVMEEAPDEIRKLYGDKPRSLRIMLPFEWNATSPQGEELVYSLYNRAYGNSKGLKCRGTGRSAEFPGTARTSDESYARRIEVKTGVAPQAFKGPTGDQFWTVRCFGRDCPLFIHKVRVPDPDNPAREIDAMAPGHDRDASCTDAAILRCFLLHTEADPASDDYCRVLGVMELATGSINSIIDLQSGFDLVKHFAGGRSAGVPMTLVRHMITTYRVAKAPHWPVKVSFDQREVQRWAARPLNEVFLSEAQAALLRQLQATPLAASVDSVRDLIPRALPATLESNGGQSAPSATPTSQATTPETPAATDGPPPGVEPDQTSDNVDPADTPLLVGAQQDELKQLAGGPENSEKPYDKFANPWKQESLDRLRGAVVAMREAMGIEQAMTLSELRVGHYHWLKQRLSTLPPLEE